MKRYINIYKCIFTNVLNLQSAYHLEMYLLEVSMWRVCTQKEGCKRLDWHSVSMDDCNGNFFLVLQKLTVLYL